MPTIRDPNQRQLKIAVTRELYMAVEREAARRRVTLSDVAREAIEQHIERTKHEPVGDWE